LEAFLLGEYTGEDSGGIDLLSFALSEGDNDLPWGKPPTRSGRMAVGNCLKVWGHMWDVYLMPGVSGIVNPVVKELQSVVTPFRMISDFVIRQEVWFLLCSFVRKIKTAESIPLVVQTADGSLASMSNTLNTPKDMLLFLNELFKQFLATGYDQPKQWDFDMYNLLLCPNISLSSSSSSVVVPKKKDTKVVPKAKPLCLFRVAELLGVKRSNGKLIYCERGANCRNSHYDKWKEIPKGPLKLKVADPKTMPCIKDAVDAKFLSG
jgi:hypothetical protein